MNRNRIAALAALAVLAVAVGITLAVTQASGPERAAADTAPAANTVSVSGTGTVEGVPDTLVANLRVHSLQSSVQAALNASASDARKVITVLGQHDVARGDIRTTDLSLNPHYDSHGVIDGYNSAESLSIRIHPLAHVGDVLTAAAGAAGNSVTVNGLSFDIADNSTLLSAARANAFANAKAAATQYATLGGTTLSHVEHVTSVVHNASPVFHQAFAKDTLAMSSAGARAGVPIRPGQKKVSVTVKVIWALS
jgi:uncharacterized protein YggE